MSTERRSALLPHARYATMRFSVAMCTYNGARFISEQLQSLALQSRLPDELVACDDRSDDGTIEIIRKFAKSSPFPVHLVINRKTYGSKLNFQKAIGLCRGNLIALCDQDDVWRKEKLALIERAFLSNPTSGYIFSDAEIVDESLRTLGALSERLNFEDQIHEKPTLRALLRINFVTGATLAFRADLRRLVLPIPVDTILQHDAWIALILAAVAPVVFLKQPLIRYRQHESQQIGVRVPGTKYAHRQGSLVQAVHDICYPAGELHALKTVYARLITKSSALVAAEDLRQIEDRIIRLENEGAILENEKAPGAMRKDWKEMQQYLDSRIIRIAPYLWKDISRLRYRLRPRDLLGVLRILRSNNQGGINPTRRGNQADRFRKDRKR